MRTKTLEQYSAQKIAGLQTDQLQKLRNGNMTFDQIKWFTNLSFEEREELFGKRPNKTPILKIISENETLMLDAVNGNETIRKATQVFRMGIDSNFYWWGAKKPSHLTEACAVQVYKTNKDATLQQMFSSSGDDLDKLCLTQHQIINFCAKHKNWLLEKKDATILGLPTFFLFKIENQQQYCVAAVCVRLGGLSAAIRYLGHSTIFSANRSYVVIPQNKD